MFPLLFIPEWNEIVLKQWEDALFQCVTFWAHFYKQITYGFGTMYKCKKCGICCSNVDKSPLYSDLDRGDGKCKYYNETSKRCTIYESRPIKCNIEKTYELYFKDKLSKEDFYNLNYEACKTLRNE